MSRESFVRGAVSNPEQSTFYSDARVSSTMSAETTDLVTPDLIQGKPPKVLFVHFIENCLFYVV